jgi:hypothetical protein
VGEGRRGQTAPHGAAAGGHHGDPGERGLPHRFGAFGEGGGQAGASGAPGPGRGRGHRHGGDRSAAGGGPAGAGDRPIPSPTSATRSAGCERKQMAPSLPASGPPMPGGRGGWRPFLHHVSKGKPYRGRAITLKAPGNCRGSSPSPRRRRSSMPAPACGTASSSPCFTKAARQREHAGAVHYGSKPSGRLTVVRPRYGGSNR